MSIKYRLDLIPEIKALAKDRRLNPIGAIIEVESITESSDGEFQINLSTRFSYNPILLILAIPFYIISAITKNPNIGDWADNVAYFKRLTERGFQKRREQLDAVKNKIISEAQNRWKRQS